MDYLLDTPAWIEYFRGSETGKQIKKMVDNPNNKVYTAECSIAELWEWADRERIDFSEIMAIINAISSLRSISLSDWKDAARIKKERRKTHKDFGLMDSLILCKQLQLRCKLITGDPHFAGLSDVILY